MKFRIFSFKIDMLTSDPFRLPTASSVSAVWKSLNICPNFNFFFPFFQFLNTRSQKGEKDKSAGKDQDSGSEVDENNLSLMDRTKRQAKAAREQQRREDEDEVQDLEEVIRQTRERVKVAKASKSRAAALRLELQDLQDEEQSIAGIEDTAPAADPAPPVPKSNHYEAFGGGLKHPPDSQAFIRANRKCIISLK